MMRSTAAVVPAGCAQAETDCVAAAYRCICGIEILEQQAHRLGRYARSRYVARDRQSYPLSEDNDGLL